MSQYIILTADVNFMGPAISAGIVEADTSEAAVAKLADKDWAGTIIAVSAPLAQGIDSDGIGAFHILFAVDENEQYTVHKPGGKRFTI